MTETSGGEQRPPVPGVLRLVRARFLLPVLLALAALAVGLLALASLTSDRTAARALATAGHPEVARIDGKHVLDDRYGSRKFVTFSVETAGRRGRWTERVDDATYAAANPGGPVPVRVATVPGAGGAAPVAELVPGHFRRQAARDALRAGVALALAALGFLIVGLSVRRLRDLARAGRPVPARVTALERVTPDLWVRRARFRARFRCADGKTGASLPARRDRLPGAGAEITVYRGGKGAGMWEHDLFSPAAAWIAPEGQGAAAR